jgi:6-phosphogluconolactonase
VIDMPAAGVLVHAGPQALADAVAGRLLTRLVEAQSTGRLAQVVLTGGTIADTIHRSIAASESRDAVDWSRVEVWWGDERFVAADDPDRNDSQARAALLDQLPLNPDLVHAMPTPEQTDGDVDLAAHRYAETLAASSGPADRAGVPTFDVLMLGVGPEGHVASLFPDRPAVYESELSVVGVRHSPKPPPLRISLTLPALNRAAEVWFVVSGAEKAHAVHLALSGAGVVQIPAAGPHGLRATTWFLDRESARDLPAGLGRVASP